MEKTAVAHFKAVDPVLAPIIAKLKLPPPLKKSNNSFEDLCESIASQQLSVKASDTIFARFKALFPNNIVNPKFVLDLTIDQIRAAGFSNTKAVYIKDLAQRVSDGLVQLDQFDQLPDDEVINELVKVKGIGQWTAEMFLMFSLGRPDVFSYGDLGIRKAMHRLYNIGDNSPQEASRIAEKWRPYRTYACRILWRSLELQ